MKLRLWQVDAFTSHRLAGNPAAVVPLERWLDDDLMLAIAAENNLSETAFFVHEPDGWRIRWFTPAAEVPLCGHATLASGHVMFTHLEPGRASVDFASASGRLSVTREGPRLTLDFPAHDAERIEAPAPLAAAIGTSAEETWLGPRLMAVLPGAADVAAVRPDFVAIAQFPGRGLIVTAPGDRSDFVSRYFAPKFGVNEDPVTGSAHCQLTPYWARRLGKTSLHALQLSRRGGELWCSLRDGRVALSGEVVEYLSGTIEV